MRRQLFDDLFLLPELVFVSPGGHGVKAFVPYDLGRTSDVKQNAAENIYWLMEYARLRYGDCSGTKTRAKEWTTRAKTWCGPASCRMTKEP